MSGRWAWQARDTVLRATLKKPPATDYVREVADQRAAVLALEHGVRRARRAAQEDALRAPLARCEAFKTLAQALSMCSSAEVYRALRLEIVAADEPAPMPASPVLASASRSAAASMSDVIDVTSESDAEDCASAEESEGEAADDADGAGCSKEPLEPPFHVPCWVPPSLTGHAHSCVEVFLHSQEYACCGGAVQASAASSECVLRSEQRATSDASVPQTSS